jgi:ribonuclease D
VADGPPPAWIDAAPALDELIEALAASDEYAVDTEFHRERTYWPQLALLQFGWRHSGAMRVALVDPLAVDVRPLGRLFDSDVLAVVHAASQDLEVFDRAVGSAPRRIFDTQIAAGFAGFSSPSLATLAEKLVDIRLVKGDRLSDWTQRPLTEGQVSYAADDVAHLLDIKDELVRRLTRSDRLQWAEDECAGMLTQPRGPQDPDIAWWRIKEGRSLRGKARWIAQEVAAWRERRAATIDRPVRQVLPDLGVVTVANRPPTSPRDLKGMRGLEGRVPGGAAAEELIEAVRRGQAIDARDLRLPPVDDFERDLRPAVTLVSAWVSQLARDLGIETALLATRSDLQAFLSGDSAARLANGWRAQLVGEPVRRLVDGEAALAFRPGSADLVLVDVPPGQRG